MCRRSQHIRQRSGMVLVEMEAVLEMGLRPRTMHEVEEERHLREPDRLRDNTLCWLMSERWGNINPGIPHRQAFREFRVDICQEPDT